MGKLHSKHVCKREGPEGECILSNVHLNPAISSDGSVSQLDSHSITKKSYTDDLLNFNNLPLKVLLPPEREEKKLNMESDTTDNNVSTEKTINVEEFECGVSVEGSSSDKQEWNFTLYDFDGRGKITKEDLAQLLQSLYDAVGSSINLPQTGTRTLKLKLSVSPDNAKVTNLDAAIAGMNKDVSVMKSVQPGKSQSKHNKDKENCRSRERHGNSASAKDNVQNNQVFKLRLQKSNLTGVCGAGNAYKPQLEIKNNLSIGLGHSQSARKRLSSHEHKHLAELVQKNMDRNQQRQSHKIKRHHSEQAPKTSYGNDRTCTQNVENPDRRNYYLDLAGIENYESAKLHNTSAPPGLLDTSAHGHGSHRPHNRTHDYTRLRASKPQHASDSKRQSRSRSHEVSPGLGGAQTANLEAAAEQFAVQYEEAVEDEYVSPGAGAAAGPSAGPAFTSAGVPAYASGLSPRLQPKSASNPKTHKFRPVSLPAQIPETVSPHHHRRHRNRERNHTRAMQQVAEWIDRELPCGGSQRVVVQKHEHHHVHEHHHHHHYHHYHET